MTESEKCDTWTTFHTPDPLMGTFPVETTSYAVSDLLEEPGNCRQYMDSEQSLCLLRKSLYSEQQKLRDVLKWAEGFLQGPPEACNEFCSLEDFTLARVKHAEKEQIPPANEISLGAKYQQPIRPTASNDKAYVTVEDSEVYQPSSPNYKNKSKEKNYVCGYKPLFQRDPLLPSSCSPVEDEETWLQSRETEKMKRLRLQHTNNKQTLHRANCSTSRTHVSNQRHHKETSDCSSVQTLASDSATRRKESSAVFGAVSTSQALYDSSESPDMRLTSAGVYSQKKMSGNRQERWKEMERVDNCEELKLNCKQKEKLKQMQEHQDSSLDSAICTYDEINDSEKEKITEWSLETANLSMRLPSHLTVCEQYKLCVDLLHHSRLNQHINPTNLTQSVKKPSASATLQLNCQVTNPENKSHSGDIGNRAAESTGERVSHLLSEDLDSSQDTKGQAAPSEHVTTESCETNTVNEAPAGTEAGGRQMNLAGMQSDDLLKESADDSISYDAVRTRPDESSWRKPQDFDTSAFTANPGRLLKNKSPPLMGKGCQQDATAPRRTTGDRVRRRLCEGSRNILTDRLRSSNQNTIKYLKKRTSHKCTKTPDSSVKHTSSDSDTHRIQRTTETHTLQQEATLPAEGAAECVSVNDNGCKNRPAGVHVCDRWMCLPDEVWLSVLSLVPQRDLCTVLQVCHRLRTLANDHTLWRHLRIENSSVNDQWLLCVGRRRPHTLCLSSCSSQSVSSSGLQQFFSLCRNSLQELKVTSCIGAGLHGDQVLTLIGQLCDSVTSVDVSWSGATDSGLKALSDCSKRLTLRSIVLNGCKITDVPLKRLIMKHHESLGRLEVFGCHFLSPSCLQAVYKMCPGLQHLNIGRVPKVNVHSFTVMSQLKCLISLNLSGLQVITDASVDSLLQNCVKLQCLTLSSCPAITDLTLHNISKHTPCIRSLGLSGCAAVTDAGIQSLALGCRRLQQLDLSSTHTGTRGVSLLANYCSSHLHTVKLSFCHITSDIILKLCRNCKRLKVLHLYGCVHPPTGGQISNVNSAVKVYPPH